MITNQAQHTIDDLIAMPDDDKRYELIDGEIIERGTSSETHALLGVWLILELGFYIRTHQLGGRLRGADGTYQLDPANARVPDVSYSLPGNVAKLPKNIVFVPFAPDFVIEIKLPSNSAVGMRRLAARYIKAGAALVWTIDPEEQVAHVYRPGEFALELSEADVLSGYDVLPGFAISLPAMFAQIADV